jgi:gamma-glutamyltranspeptidase/glutathione hydrolase
VHGLVEATKQAFLWRDAHCGDPQFMEADPRALLADAAGLDAMAAKIDASRALPWPQPSQQGDTVWFGAADKDGMVVSVIQSTYFEFGSGLVLPKPASPGRTGALRSDWRKMAGTRSGRGENRSIR